MHTDSYMYTLYTAGLHTENGAGGGGGGGGKLRLSKCRGGSGVAS